MSGFIKYLLLIGVISGVLYFGYSIYNHRQLKNDYHAKRSVLFDISSKIQSFEERMSGLIDSDSYFNPYKFWSNDDDDYCGIYFRKYLRGYDSDNYHYFKYDSAPDFTITPDSPSRYMSTEDDYDNCPQVPKYKIVEIPGLATKTDNEHAVAAVFNIYQDEVTIAADLLRQKKKPSEEIKKQRLEAQKYMQRKKEAIENIYQKASVINDSLYYYYKKHQLALVSRNIAEQRLHKNTSLMFRSDLRYAAGFLTEVNNDKRKFDEINLNRFADAIGYHRYIERYNVFAAKFDTLFYDYKHISDAQAQKIAAEFRVLDAIYKTNTSPTVLTANGERFTTDTTPSMFDTNERMQDFRLTGYVKSRAIIEYLLKRNTAILNSNRTVLSSKWIELTEKYLHAIKENLHKSKYYY